jgi:hypothetical protein
VTKIISLSRRIVVTKNATYELNSDQVGRPAPDVFGPEMAERLGIADATIYDMPDGRRVIARPDDN